MIPAAYFIDFGSVGDDKFSATSFFDLDTIYVR